jgi:hypothetical protein
VAHVVRAPGDGGAAQGLEAVSGRVTVVFFDPGTCTCFSVSPSGESPFR